MTNNLCLLSIKRKFPRYICRSGVGVGIPMGMEWVSDLVVKFELGPGLVICKKNPQTSGS